MEVNTVINDEYVTVDVIENMISTRIKKPFQRADIMEWCMEIETMILPDADLMKKFVNVRLPIVNIGTRRARKPCNIWRLLDVFGTVDDPSSKVSNSTNSGYITIEDTTYSKDYVYVNYIGTKVDELTGQYLIWLDHRLACMHYCIKQMYFGDWLDGVIDNNKWMGIEAEFEKAISVAESLKTRHFQRQDFMNLAIIQGNMLPRIGDITLYQDSFGE